MRRYTAAAVHRALTAIVAMVLCHLAIPFAVSAQGLSTIRVEVTVVPAGNAWGAQALADTLARAIRDTRGAIPRHDWTPASGATVASDRAYKATRRVWRGTIVGWFTPSGRLASPTVTVAHLGN